MIVDQSTALYGLIGHPVRYSLSPIMLNAAFSALGLNAVYLAFDVEDLFGCIDGLRSLGIRGVSVTMPHKSSVLPHLDEVDRLARQIGAVNTIVNQGGTLIGHNTDGLGALRSLEAKTALSGKRCLIVGAGGAARAIAFVLREKGVEVQISNRTAERGERLARSLRCPFVPLAGLGCAEADIVVHASSAGMSPYPELCIIPERILKQGMVVMDIVYNPLTTRLLRTAQERGCLTIQGWHMFLYQGAEQIRLWTGREPPLEVMEQVVKESLGEARESKKP